MVCGVPAKTCSVCNISAADNSRTNRFVLTSLEALTLHTEYKNVTSLAVITPSDKLDSTFLSSELRHRGNAFHAGAITNPTFRKTFPLVRDANRFIDCCRRL